VAKAPSLRKDRTKGTQRTRKLSAGNAPWSWRNGKERFVGTRRGTAGAKPYTMKVVRTVFNGGHEETYGNATRLVPTQLIDVLMEVSFQRPIAAGRVRRESTTLAHRQVGCLLHRLDGETLGRLEDDRSLAADPRDNGRAIFFVMPPAGLALLATPPCAASQRLLATPFRLALVASGVIEVIRFDRACQLAVHLVGQGGIAQPPAPAIARVDTDTQFSGEAMGGARETQQKGGEQPVGERPFALVQQGVGEVVKGAITAVAPGAFAPGAVVVHAPGAHVVAVTPGTLQWAIFPPQRMKIGVAGISIEELVEV
jgi:hypothetical protein